MASKRRASTYTMSPAAFERQLIRHGATAADIVRKTGLDRRVIAKAEKGVPVSMPTINAIAKFFGVESAELGVVKFTGEEVSKAPNTVADGQSIDSARTIGASEEEYRSWLTQEEDLEKGDFYLSGIDASDEFEDPNPVELKIEIIKQYRSNGDLKLLVKLKLKTDSWGVLNRVDATALGELLQFQIKNDIVKRSKNNVGYGDLAFLKFTPVFLQADKTFVLQAELTQQQAVLIYTWACRVSASRAKHQNKLSLHSFSSTESSLIEYTNWVSNSDRAFGYPYVAEFNFPVLDKTNGLIGL